MVTYSSLRSGYMELVINEDRFPCMLVNVNDERGQTRPIWDNESGPGSVGSTHRSLTHPPDPTGRGLR